MSVDTDIERLRLRIGDTDVSPTTNARFKDSELQYFLDAESNDIPAAALLAIESWIAKIASRYNFTTDGQSFERNQEVQAFLALAKYWRGLGITTTADSTVGGVRTVDVTKVDGWSDDVANQDVTGTTDTARRLNVYPGVDELP